MQINKNDLKKISRDFRTCVSEISNSNHRDMLRKIKILTDYVNNTPIIIEYINSIDSDNLDVEKIISKGGFYNVKPHDLGYTAQDEVIRIYKILCYIVDNEYKDFFELGSPYTSSRQFADMARAFSTNIVNVFARHINNYLLEIHTEMGFDKEGAYMIEVNGGNAQVNIANDEAKIDATQNNYNQNHDLQNVIKQIRENISNEFDGETRESISQNLDSVESQLVNSTPDKNLIKVLLTGLKSIACSVPTAVTTVEGVNKLYEMASKMLGF